MNETYSETGMWSDEVKPAENICGKEYKTFTCGLPARHMNACSEGLSEIELRVPVPEEEEERTYKCSRCGGKRYTERNRVRIAHTYECPVGRRARRYM